MADENKTERVQLLMTPSELKAIDDWSFNNRIRGRAEAIRRLCQIGMFMNSTMDELIPTLKSSLAKEGDLSGPIKISNYIVNSLAVFSIMKRTEDIDFKDETLSDFATRLLKGMRDPDVYKLVYETIKDKKISEE